MANDLGARAELEVDLGETEIDLAARIDVLGKDIGARLARLEDKTPRGRYQVIYGSVAVPAAGVPTGGLPMVTNPPSPPPNRMWLVQWAAVFPVAAPFTAVANLNAIICVGRPPVGPGGGAPAVTTLSPGDIVIPNQAVPDTINVPDKTVVRSSTALYAILSGAGLGAAGTTYMMTVGVIDVADSEEALFW